MVSFRLPLGLVALVSFAAISASCASAPAPGPDHDLAVLPSYASARMGDGNAQLALGLALIDGEGIERNEARGVEWIRRAASTGHARAQAKLGLLYLSGRGVPRDTALAHLWYLRAAEAGDDEGMAGLAVVHVQSDFDGRDPIEAMKWALLAARRSNAFAERLIEREFATLSPEERALAKTRADAWERARAVDLPHGDRER